MTTDSTNKVAAKTASKDPSKTAKKAASKAPATKTAKKETNQSTSKPNSSKESAYAIVESSGQQFWMQPNRYYDIDRLQAKVDETITLNNVLLLKNGKDATVGKPYVEGATVELKVLSHRRGPKIIVYKMRPKKKTRRKNGHRQELTRVMVKSISLAGKALN